MNPTPTDTRKPFSGHLRFVLVHTSRPGNVGAAARAMKNMGFSELVLVSPRVGHILEHEEAVAFASGAQDVLSAARIVDSLEEAVANCQIVAAISARLREFSPPLLTPRCFAARLHEQSGLHTAIVFGNERFGLSNEAVQRCNALIHIPANPAYSSLNLAQAVQVIAYEIRMTGMEKQTDSKLPSAGTGFRGEMASRAQIEGMFTHIEQALIAIDFLDPARPKKLMPRLRRLFARTELETEEVNILRGIANQILTGRKRINQKGSRTP